MALSVDELRAKVLALRERGLNDQQYIVPGAGGLGEVINNVFV